MNTAGLRGQGVRIASVRTVTVRIPLEEPVVLGGGLRISEREYVLVVLTAEGGLTGVGWSYTRGAISPASSGGIFGG
jgi:L-alanine-DL-glutamate epimerase-like enolase superfamily enzyme